MFLEKPVFFSPFTQGLNPAGGRREQGAVTPRTGLTPAASPGGLPPSRGDERRCPAAGRGCAARPPEPVRSRRRDRVGRSAMAQKCDVVVVGGGISGGSGVSGMVSCGGPRPRSWALPGTAWGRQRWYHSLRVFKRKVSVIRGVMRCETYVLPQYPPNRCRSYPWKFGTDEGYALCCF